MTFIEYASSAAPVVFGALGTWFLVREVDYAHQFEEMSREMAEIKELLLLYQTNIREFWIRSAMRSFKRDRSKTEKMAQNLSDADIQKATADYKQMWEKDAQKSMDRWYGSTVQAQLRFRRRLLWTGFALLMLGAAIQFFAETSKWFGAE